MRVLLYCVATVAALFTAGAAIAYDDAFQAALDAAVAVDPTAANQVTNDPGRDIAVGGGDTTFGYRFSIAASSDPLGGDPRGHVRVTSPEGTVMDGQVACLQVSAVSGFGLVLIGVETGAPESLLITASDGGPSGPDSIGIQPSTDPASELCAGSPIWEQLVESGQIMIRDALTG